MKGILEFNLDEEHDDFELAANARQLAIILTDLDNYLRAINKYGSEEDVFESKEAKQAAQAVRDELNRLIQDSNIAHLLY